jgi:NTP pyrophosphatase (non-canonical NTP hydrolase)
MTVNDPDSVSSLLHEYVDGIPPTDRFPEDNLRPVLMGLFGEVGSVMAPAKKLYREKEAYPRYRAAVEEEFGDTLWYLAALSRRIGQNLHKLILDALENQEYAKAASNGNLGLASSMASPDQLDDVLHDMGVAASSLLTLRIVHMQAHAARWGVLVSRPTTGQVVAERTAAIVWSVLSRISASVFLWNVFPLHPHETGMPFTNRAHNVRERQAGEELLSLLVDFLHPHRLVAIGNDAAASVYRVSQHANVVHVRHPIYGGHKEFLQKMQDIYSLPEGPSQSRLFS